MYSLHCIDGHKAETIPVHSVHCVGSRYANPLRCVEIAQRSTMQMGLLLRDTKGNEVVIRTTPDEARDIGRRGTELVLERVEN